MSWQEVLGHDELVERFRLAARRDRLAATFLFMGPAGIGKHTFAVKLAQALLCETNAESELEPCGRCPACVQVDARTHPDLLSVAKPEDKAFIPIELFIGDQEHRMRQGLCHDLALKPFHGGRKIVIIDDADYLNVEGANCLLKLLEEPPARSVVILIGTSDQKQLPTIRSRCQIVRFRPLDDDVLAQLLVSQEILVDQREAHRVAHRCQGSLERARQLANPDLWNMRSELLDALSSPQIDQLGLVKAVNGFIDSAESSPPVRRQHLRELIGFAADFYRELVRQLTGAPSSSDDQLKRTVAHALPTWQGRSVDAAASLDRCLEALGHVDRNANQAGLVECWLDELTPAKN